MKSAMASTAAFVPQPPSAHTHPGTEHGGARLTWAASATAAASGLGAGPPGPAAGNEHVNAVGDGGGDVGEADDDGLAALESAWLGTYLPSHGREVPYRPRACADKHQRGVEDAELAGGGLEVLAHSGEVRKDIDDIGGVWRGINGHG